jgi:hypothetical protein
MGKSLPTLLFLSLWSAQHRLSTAHASGPHCRRNPSDSKPPPPPLSASRCDSPSLAFPSIFHRASPPSPASYYRMSPPLFLATEASSNTVIAASSNTIIAASFTPSPLAAPVGEPRHVSPCPTGRPCPAGASPRQHAPPHHPTHRTCKAVIVLWRNALPWFCGSAMPLQPLGQAGAEKPWADANLVFMPKPSTHRMHDTGSIVPHIQPKVFTDNQMS